VPAASAEVKAMPPLPVEFKATPPESAPANPATLSPETANVAPPEAAPITPDARFFPEPMTPTATPIPIPVPAIEHEPINPPPRSPEDSRTDTNAAASHDWTTAHRPAEPPLETSYAPFAARPGEPLRPPEPRTVESAAHDEPETATAVLAPAAARKLLRRRRRATVLAFLGIAVVVFGVGQFIRNDHSPTVTTVVPAASALPPVRPPGGVLVPSKVGPGRAGNGLGTAGASGGAGTQPTTGATRSGASRPLTKPGAFTFVTGYGPILGTAGRLRRFKVAVEKTTDQGNGRDFADEVDRTLGDSRSWIGSRKLRLQRVPATATSDFTIYLASARTSKRLCKAGGLATDGYTSCRLPGQVILNSDRWQDSVPGYDAPLATYRDYAINHEVGHQLGHGHEACRGKGRLAPVMQQQTYGLKGCVANAWPYIGGRRYAGKPEA
jgi:hypothetical protein